MERSYTNGNLYGQLELNVAYPNLDQDWLILNHMVTIVRRCWVFIELMSLMEKYEDSNSMDLNKLIKTKDFNSVDFISAGKFDYCKSKCSLGALEH